MNKDQRFFLQTGTGSTVAFTTVHLIAILFERPDFHSIINGCIIFIWVITIACILVCNDWKEKTPN